MTLERGHAPIAVDELPAWVPGRLTVRSPDAGSWGGVTVRGWSYGPSDVAVPPLRDHTVIAYRRGRCAVRRRLGAGGDPSDWAHERVGPGDVSLLTRSAPSHWVWPSDLEVVHVYLDPAVLADLCRQMYDREVDDVVLRDELRADDPGIHRAALLVAAEAAQGRAGDRLMVDALAQQLGVLILRHHAELTFRAPAVDDGAGGLTPAQQRAVRDHVAAHLTEKLTLADLAASVSLSPYHFARRFRAATGTSPHEFVVRARVAHAETLLRRADRSLTDVAAACGFADQSHLTRVFRRRVGTTPGRYRERA